MNAGSNASIKILVTLQAFLLQLVHLVLQYFNGALLLRQLILHALQLVEQFALCRGSGRSRSPRIGAVRAITCWRITAPAIVIARVAIFHRNRSPHRKRCEAESQYS